MQAVWDLHLKMFLAFCFQIFISLYFPFSPFSPIFFCTDCRQCSVNKEYLISHMDTCKNICTRPLGKWSGLALHLQITLAFLFTRFDFIAIMILLPLSYQLSAPWEYSIFARYEFTSIDLCMQLVSKKGQWSQSYTCSLIVNSNIRIWSKWECFLWNALKVMRNVAKTSHPRISNNNVNGVHTFV